MKTKRLLMILLVMVLGGYRPPVQAQDSSDAPYIYYYSEEQSSFIIERADGSDSHILTSFEMPQPEGGRPLISGPGWSQSGKWFAWTVRVPEAGGAVGSVGLIVSRDGETLVDLSTEAAGDTRFDMEWSPSDDLLAVRETYFPPDTDGSDITTRQYTYSPETLEVVLELEPTPYSPK